MTSRRSVIFGWDRDWNGFGGPARQSVRRSIGACRTQGRTSAQACAHRRCAFVPIYAAAVAAAHVAERRPCSNPGRPALPSLPVVFPSKLTPQAISRLPANEGYDRVYRFRVAFQQDLMRRPLPKEQWLKPEDDVRYLTPYIKEVAREDKERADWDSVLVKDKL